MDEAEDEARVNPNPNPSLRRGSFRSPLFVHAAAAAAASDDPNTGSENEEDDQPAVNRDFDDSNSESGNGSGDSRGKRQRLDKFALGFEFAPRVNHAAAAAAASPAPVRGTPFFSDWTEEATFALLDAWGERFVQNGRRSIRSEEWLEVSKIVSAASPMPRSEGQCRNRLDTLKKKYKKELARIATVKSRAGAGTSAGNSAWIYFDKIDSFLAPVAPPLPPPSQQHQHQHQQQRQASRPPSATENQDYTLQNGSSAGRDGPVDTGSEAELEDDDGRGHVSEDDMDEDTEASYRMLAESIQKFGEVYERMECNRRQQMAELDRIRKEFQRDLEVQRQQILERALAQIESIREEEEEEEEEREEEEEEEGSDNDNDAEEDEIDASP